MEACSNCPNCTCNKSGYSDIDSNVTLSNFFDATAVSSESSNLANEKENITLSNFFDDIVIPTKPRKDKPECFWCSG